MKGRGQDRDYPPSLHEGSGLRQEIYLHCYTHAYIPAFMHSCMQAAVLTFAINEGAIFQDMISTAITWMMHEE